jgi:hypothetical protein
LETETYVLLIDFYLDSWFIAFQNRLTNSEIDQFIKKVYQTIQNRIKNRKEYKKAQKAFIEKQRQR